MMLKQKILKEFLSIEVLIFFTLLVVEFNERLSCEFGGSFHIEANREE